MKLYSLEEVAEQLGVSLSTIRRLLKGGHLAHVRIRGQNRVSDSDLSAFIAANTRRAPRAQRR